MKALLSTATGGPETLVLGDLPEPVAGPGQVVVAVKACSINFPDTLIIEDRYQFKPPRPFAPGGEIAGLVDSIGEGVTGFAVGDRVLAGCGNGGLSEKIVLGTHNLYKMPAESGQAGGREPDISPWLCDQQPVLPEPGDNHHRPVSASAQGDEQRPAARARCWKKERTGQRTGV